MKVNTPAVPTATRITPAKNNEFASLNVCDIHMVTNVLTTGARPKTSGMTYTGLPWNLKANTIPNAPSAPAAPPRNDQTAPITVQLPFSPLALSTSKGTTTAIRK